MSTRYKFVDKQAVYFATSTIVGWTDIFTRTIYKTILLDSIRHCQQNQVLVIHACLSRWCSQAGGVDDKSPAYHI